MSCCSCKFDKTLHYVSPAHGSWGVVRIAALVPESYQLFVSPFACGRHGALGGAVNKIKDRISYLYIDESDIVSGSYEDLIDEAVDELFLSLAQKPKVLLIFVSCLDDLLGTDHEQVNKKLSTKYPEIEFRTCHMNPISLGTPLSPGVSLQNNIYSLLLKSDKKAKAINLLGNNVAIHKDCELYEIVKNHGYTIKHITDFNTFKDFQSMSASILNLVISPVAQYASKIMEKSLAIEALQAYHSYDLCEIKAFYAELASILKIEIDYKQYEQEAKRSIKEALDIIAQNPIALDYQAVRKPFTLAKALLSYGFNVTLVMSDETKSFEKEAYEYILQNHPKLEIVNALHHDMPKLNKTQSNYLCIGFDCAYLTGSNKVVGLMEDESLFAFDGIKKLMGMMIEASQSEINLKQAIEEAGLII